MVRRDCTAATQRRLAARDRGFLAALVGDGRAEAVELTGNGERVAADIVVVGLGAVPNTEWLAGSGLRLEPGASNATPRSPPSRTRRTSWAPATSSRGPIRWPTAKRSEIERWTVAAEQGQLAGRQRDGGPHDERKPYDAPPVLLVRPIRREDPVAGAARPRRAWEGVEELQTGRGPRRDPGRDRGDQSPRRLGSYPACRTARRRRSTSCAQPSQPTQAPARAAA